MSAIRVVCVVAAAAAVAVGQDGARWEKMLKEAKVGLVEAIEKAQKEVVDGTVFHAELEGGKRVLYSIDIAKGDKSVNVHVDAVEGKVVLTEEEDEDHSGEVKACRVTLAAAVQAALKKGTGQAVEAEVLLRAGKAVIEVKVMQDGRLVTVNVDGATGKAIGGQAAKGAFTETFRVEEGELGPTGANPYFILEPGHVLTLEGKDGGEDALLVITVLDETKKVDGVETRVVEERESVGGKLVEVSRNFFAISKRTNSVFYFGEDVDMYRDGNVVGHGGAWLSGEKGAKFGLMMPGTPLLGARYCQEIAPGVAMDRAEIVGVDETFETPAGTFEHCLKTEETTPLEKGREHKIYAPGIGLVKDGPLKLTKHGREKK